MKSAYFYCLCLATFFVVTVPTSLVFADISANISTLCQSFNGLNDDKGISFVYTNINDCDNGSEFQFNLHDLYSVFFVSTLSGFGNETSGDDYFTSVCMDSGENVASAGTVFYGTLNYDAVGDLTQTSGGNTVSLGAAYLFKLYATGEMTSVLSSFYSDARDANVRELSDAVQHLTGTAVAVRDNIYLNYLSGLSGGQFAGIDWYADYNIAQTFGFMGGYAVFAMNVSTDEGVVFQDGFYISTLDTGISTRAVGLPDTPEPATLLLWTIGGAGLAGTSWIRKRRNKNPS